GRREKCDQPPRARGPGAPPSPRLAPRITHPRSPPHRRLTLLDKSPISWRPWRLGGLCDLRRKAFHELKSGNRRTSGMEECANGGQYASLMHKPFRGRLSRRFVRPFLPLVALVLAACTSRSTISIAAHGAEPMQSPSGCTETLCDYFFQLCAD